MVMGLVDTVRRSSKILDIIDPRKLVTATDTHSVALRSAVLQSSTFRLVQK